MIRYLSLFLFIAFISNLQAQKRILTHIDSSKLEMIVAIEQYAAKELQLKLKPDFYNKWERPDSMTAYLYVSSKDSVYAIKGLPAFLFFGTNYHAADSADSVYTQKGYETMIYKTAGNSNCRLSSRLLAYPPHAIAFICFHELYHRHRQAGKYQLPYNFEEAFCDVLGNTAPYHFFKAYSETHPEYRCYMDSSLFQRQVNEEFYKELLEYKNYGQVSLWNIQNISNYFNLFQQDRFGYRINNAFLLRTLYYAKHYFLLRDYTTSQKDLVKSIKFVSELKGKETSMIKRIKRKTKPTV